LTAPVYDELYALAQRQRRGWRGDDTLNTTALVHEAYLKLAGRPGSPWQSRAHFLATASVAMRQILLDYAKAKRVRKRGGGRARVSLHEIESGLRSNAPESTAEALIALDESLHRLARREPTQSRIVECRFFGEMTIRETAEALGISDATVKRAWSVARAWLYRDIQRTLEAPS
jgi:RNA polymerase sigma factor (TIGR02999 family)